VGKRASFCYGKNAVWDFEYKDIVTFVRKYCWLFNLGRMPQSYFRTIVRKEYNKNPWYTTIEVARILHLKSKNTVAKYIRLGLLKAKKRSRPGPDGEYIIRKSALDEFIRKGGSQSDIRRKAAILTLTFKIG